MIATDRSLEQRRLALAKANEHRALRKELKERVRAGLVEPADVVAEPLSWAESMRVRDLLLAVPGYGRHRVDRALMMTRTAPSKTLVGLSDRQRAALVVWLRGRHRWASTVERKEAA